MGLTLREILALEGQTKVDGLKDALVQLEGHLYSPGFTGVVAIYKAGAMLRQLDENGHNVSEASIRLFDSFIEMMEQAITDLGYSATDDDGDELIAPPESEKRIIAALLNHNSASASARVNGNDVKAQGEHNLWSLEQLESVPTEDRDDDWHVVNEKVKAGLLEADHIEWNEEEYNDLLQSMRERHSKDAAGRAAFLARKYMDASRIEEAIEVLVPVEEDTWSAPNQKEAAMKLLGELRKLVAAAQTE